MKCRIFRAIARFTLGAALVLQGLGASAQDGNGTPATEAIASLEQRVLEADSAQDAVVGASLRLELAGLVKPLRGLKLLQEAAALLDSTTVAPELAMRIHKELAGRYTALKAHVKANHEWVEVVRLSELLHADAAEAVEQAHSMNAALTERIDSLAAAMAVAETGHTNAMERLAEDRARREELALYGFGGGLLMLVLSVVFFAVHSRKQRAALAELRQEVTWLRMVTKMGAEPTVVAPSGAPVAPREVEVPEVLKPVASPPIVPAVTTSDPDEDAMLLALVRRRGVERLETLRAARARGDNDKVVRVVYTMKPQLVSLDAPYFQELCGRLVSTDPYSDPARWAEDLDRFEAGMARVLGQRD